jgi:hypothetical protein
MVFVLIIMISLAGVSWVLFSSKEALHRIEEGKLTGNAQVAFAIFPLFCSLNHIFSSTS